MQIDWNNLEKNTTSKELSFESFNFQIAWKKFIKYGRFEYNYNTPGAEFFWFIRLKRTLFHEVRKFSI